MTIKSETGKKYAKKAYYVEDRGVTWGGPFKTKKEADAYAKKLKEKPSLIKIFKKLRADWRMK